MAEIGSASAEDIQRTARVAGLKDFRTPTLEAIEKRRMQLWITALLLLLAVSFVLVSVTLEFGVTLPDWLRPEILQGALVVLVLLFSTYALEKEIQLRRLTKLLVAERVLTASLTNRLREITRLVDAGKALNLNLDLQGVLDTIRRCTIDLLHCRKSSIMMVQATDRLRSVTSVLDDSTKFGEGLAGRVAKSREPLLITGTARHSKAYEEPESEEVVDSAMCVPLIHRDTLLGVLQVDAGSGYQYTQHDLRAFTLFAEQAASAIANAQLYEEQRLTASRSAYQALHDTLTSLPNRAYFLGRLEKALEQQQLSEERVALLFVDVDDFREVNDTLGHFAGDEILIEISRRIRRCLRATDIAARLSSDEFAVLQEGVCGEDDAVATAQRVHKEMSEPFMTSVQATPINISASIGIALEGAGGTTAVELLRNANIAMRKAKQKREGGAVVVFDESIKTASFEKLDIERELRRALDNQEFDMCYQPIFSLTSGQLVAIEALIRWRHPDRGVIPANAFVATADRIGLIGDIDRWVFDQACSAMQNLDVDGSNPLDLHLNLLPSRLADLRTAQELDDAIGKSGVNPRRVILEISESAAMNAIQKSRTAFNAYKSVGVRLALDDFGTGYSSLTYLNRFPVEVIKIHRLFISGITELLGEADLARAIVTLGASLNMSVIAQGVERRDQLSQLRQMGCPFAQGTYLSEPLFLPELEQLMHTPDTISYLGSRVSTLS